MKKYLNLYFDPKIPGSYSGIRPFYKYLKQNKYPVSFNQVKKFLAEKDSYTLHKPIRKKFKRNRVLAFGINDTWQADLVDLTKLSRFNNGYKFLLTCIDVFRKYAWVIPLKDKSAKSIYDAIKKLFLQSKPRKLHTDKGKEFLNTMVENLLNKLDIHFYQTNSEMKASVVERFNRTLKEKMWRYFTNKKTYKYIDVLDQIVESYNNSYHRSIKMTPLQVTQQNQKQVYSNLYGDYYDQLVIFKFKIGDKVRVSKYKTIFEKGYTPNWSQEIFQIYKKIPRNPPVYELKDLNDEIIEGKFYENELQKVYKLDDIYEIDKIIRQRTKNGQKEYFVSWKDYPSTFNSWIKANDILK